MKTVTLTYLVTPSKVWLAPKLEGFGVGYLNGYGGHLEENETILDRAVLEIKQESTVDVQQKDLVAITTIDFYKMDRHVFKCHIFLATRWEGVPQATKEMGKPELYSREHPPISNSQMWKGDKLWIRQVLIGRVIPSGGFVRYDENMTEVVEWHIPSAT